MATESATSIRSSVWARPRVRGVVKRVIGTCVLLALSLAVLYPVFFSINTALRAPSEFAVDRFAIAIPPHFESLERMWRTTNIPRSLANSVGVAIAGVACLWIVGALAAYSFTKVQPRGSQLLFVLVLGSLLVPIQTILIPFFLVMKNLHLLNEYHGLVIAFTAFGVPLTVFMMAAYFRGLPREVLEAARIDGASEIQTLLRVVLPMSRPALATTGIINFVWMMNDLLIPIMVVQDRAKTPLVVDIALTRGQWAAEPTLQAAGILFGILPMIVLFLVAQRYLIRGATIGAVK